MTARDEGRAHPGLGSLSLQDLCTHPEESERAAGLRTRHDVV